MSVACLSVSFFYNFPNSFYFIITLYYQFIEMNAFRFFNDSN
jgi:hypothetical protein